MTVLPLLLLITLSEATIGVFVKLTDGRIPVWSLNFYALSAAAVTLLIGMPWVTGQALRFPRHNLRDAVIIGGLIAVQSGAFNYAMTLVPIANAVIFWSIAPLFTFVLSRVFLGEPARKIHVLIFAVALAGIVIANPLAEGNAKGNLVALGVGLAYAAMITYMRHEGKTETGNDVAWSLLVAALIFSPALVIAGPGDLDAWIAYEAIGMQLPVVLWALCLGVVSMGFAYFGISIVLKTLDANVYSLVDIIVSPVVASTLGFVIFDEVPGPGMVAGGALLLGAGAWLTVATSRGREQQAVHACQCEAR